MLNTASVLVIFEHASHVIEQIPALLKAHDLRRICKSYLFTIHKFHLIHDAFRTT